MDDVVIVGAGPAGLAAAAILKARGTDATILESGQRLGKSWRGRYDRLHLHTIRWLSHLPGYPIPREFGRWVARDQFVQYLEQYTARHSLEPRFEVEDTRIDHDDGHWRVRTSAGTIPARVVVVASGYARVPHLPRWPGVFHFAEYRNARPYLGQDVLVVGAGNSGAEIAVDLVEGGAARVRGPYAAEHRAARDEGLPHPVGRDRVPADAPRPGGPDGSCAPKSDNRRPSAQGLPRPSAPFSQFRRTATVPIIDVGFVDGVRRGVIEVVPAVTALVGPSCWPTGHACTRTQSWPPPAMTPGSSRLSVR